MSMNGLSIISNFTAATLALMLGVCTANNSDIIKESSINSYKPAGLD